MSDSYRFDPYSPDSAYYGKVTHNNTRRTRQARQAQRYSRQEEFTDAVNSAVNPQDYDYSEYDKYGDYDYSTYQPANANRRLHVTNS